ncbi:hypothetical protein BFF78_00945 [Streptomyces fodineus]|uniref:Uncharacterized protein n=1 Tax=Streptomyces fodineus TaxID=1904616 RepID=A0A1D7Y380_9ACTN|nr:hypothetical protein [Streptomyces fodineus]AOR29839.1 hypothetical protein BFF78_00945 [Streptomyces fodineus]
MEDPSALFEALRRVTFEWRTGEDVTLESIADESAGHRQVLIAAGTTKDAARLHRHLEGQGSAVRGVASPDPDDGRALP